MIVTSHVRGYRRCSLMEQMILGKLNAMMTAVDVYARLPQTLTERVTRLATRAIVCTESLQVEVLTDRKEQKILYKITFFNFFIIPFFL